MPSTNSDANPLSDLGKQVSDATILMHEAVARRIGLTGTDHKYLSLLLKHGTMTAGTLSSLTGLSTGAVTGVIDRLEKKELVKRIPDKTDRRKIMIAPDVQKAEALLKNAHLDLRAQVEQLVATFSPKEQKLIERYLTASIDILKDITIRLNDLNHG